MTHANATLTDDDASSSAHERSTAPDLARGSFVGRYVVVSKLGSGGMGIVYAGYDPELDRRVAIKLLRSDGLENDARTSEGRTRLLREAQALAKLQDPNVVTIHDVGTHRDRVFIAMELVDGKTLGAWRDATPRAWPEVLDVLVRAGRGVAAAHAAGLLHRDLKPDNIMVADDGRVRVMDFGLARADHAGDDDSIATLDPDSKPNLEALALRVTRAGALVGTPAYMAPEQLRGDALDAKTDQFSFCVTAWEALFGARPFPGDSLLQLVTAVLDGDVRSPPPGAKVPAWLRRVIERGLAVDRAQRHASMDALLMALQRGQSHVRSRRVLAIGSMLGAGAVAFYGWHHVERGLRTAACEAAGASIGEVWNPTTRTAMRDAILATRTSYAERTADNVTPWLDDQARAWQAARTDACLDATVHERWNADVHDRSVWCLEERKVELHALVSELSRGDPASIQHAISAAADLTRVTTCQDPDLLLRQPAPPHDRSEDVRAVRAVLSRAIALTRVARYDDAMALVREALTSASALDWPPLIAEVRILQGELLEHTGRYDEAETELEAAYFAAARSGAPELASRAAENLTLVVGDQLARHREALRWSQLAEVAGAGLPDPAQLRTAFHLNDLALVHSARGDYAQAKDLHERVLAIREEAYGADHPTLADTLNNLANVQKVLGAYDDAKALHRRALAIREKAYGPDHPRVAFSLNNLGSVHQALAEHEQAIAVYERALAIWQNAHGPVHPDVASAVNNVATAYWATGKHEAATAAFERALAIREHMLGPDHPEVAVSLTNVANVRIFAHAYQDAKALLERALAIAETTRGPDHPQVAQSLFALGQVVEHLSGPAAARPLLERALAIYEKALGPEHEDVAAALYAIAGLYAAEDDLERAKGLLERALAIYETALGPTHPELTYPLGALADIAIRQRRATDAIAFATRALTILQDAKAPEAAIAHVRFLLARARWDEGRDRATAIELAQQARATNGIDPAQADAIDQWLHAHATR